MGVFTYLFIASVQVLPLPIYLFIYCFCPGPSTATLQTLSPHDHQDKPSAQGLVGTPVERLIWAVLVPVVGVKHNHQQTVSTTVPKPQGSACGGSSCLPLELNKFAKTVELFQYL